LCRGPWRVEPFAGADLTVPDEAVGLALELRRLDVRLSALTDPVRLLRWTEHLVGAVARHALQTLGRTCPAGEPLPRLVERVQAALAECDLPATLTVLAAGGAQYATTLTALRAEIEDGPLEADFLQARDARFAADLAIGWARFVFGTVSDPEPVRASTVVPLPQPRRAHRTERLVAR